MESKIQKPSGLKRPTPVLRNILPMDRIKQTTGPGHGHGQGQGQRVVERTRGHSPEAGRAIQNFTSRAKLRRSRSACDIREMRPLKRADLTLAPFPAKSARLMSTESLHSHGTKASRVMSSTSAAVNCSSINTTARQPRVGAIGGTKKAVTSASTGTAKPTEKKTSTSISTTGAAKPINKRIPPYDFKARYHDLLEKHKVLKAKYEEKCEQTGSFESLSEQYEQSQVELFRTQDQLKNAEIENVCLNRQIESQTIKIDSISGLLVKAKEELDHLSKEHKKIKGEHSELTIEVVDLRERSQQLTEQNSELVNELEICREQLFRANIERKELHNTIMDLRGNIRVFCRVRPPLACEEDKLLCGWNYIDECTVEIQNLDLMSKNKGGSHVFSFDHVFHPASSQEDIFEMVSPLIQSALDGYNICIFAYGQTGSGKTYTMDGVPSNVGVIPRTVDLLFEAVKNYKRLGWEYEIRATFLEIYNEVLYDLLSNEPKDMEIRMAKNNKNDIYVSNITEETVLSAGRLRQLMQIAKMNRATAATVGNDRSSRSHAVTKIELIGRHVEKNEISIGTINLVDLAGSESPKTSIRMNETKNINRSLSELTNVILALLQKHDHIPYRNSKLTHLLMPSLGGNSKTLMFINVAPFVDCFVESVKSLRFAASVNSCRMAKAKRNRFLNTTSNTSLEK